jgi:hypothetical protein
MGDNRVPLQLHQGIQKCHRVWPAAATHDYQIVSAGTASPQFPGDNVLDTD